MTCIIGLLTDDRVYVAGDSLSQSAHRKTIRKDSKVFQIDKMLIGVSGSFRVGHLLMWGFNVPARARRVATHQYMCTTFIDAVRHRLKAGGVLEKEDGVECIIGSTSFLVGCRDGIFAIWSDFQVAVPSVCNNDPAFIAIGSGGDYAMGAMYAYLKTNEVKTRADCEAALTVALEAAERFAIGVERPFVIRSIERTG